MKTLQLAQPDNSVLEAANPLIDSDGDSYKVSTVLETVAKLFNQESSIALDESQTYGVSLILSTCAAALRKMSEISHEE